MIPERRRRREECLRLLTTGHDRKRFDMVPVRKNFVFTAYDRFAVTRKTENSALPQSSTACTTATIV
jgi:hypothetical protein